MERAEAIDSLRVVAGQLSEVARAVDDPCQARGAACRSRNLEMQLAHILGALREGYLLDCAAAAAAGGDCQDVIEELCDMVQRTNASLLLGQWRNDDGEIIPDPQYVLSQLRAHHSAPTPPVRWREIRPHVRREAPGQRAVAGAHDVD